MVALLVPHWSLGSGPVVCPPLWRALHLALSLNAFPQVLLIAVVPILVARRFRVAITLTHGICRHACNCCLDHLLLRGWPFCQRTGTLRRHMDYFLVDPEPVAWADGRRRARQEVDQVLSRDDCHCTCSGVSARIASR